MDSEERSRRTDKRLANIRPMLEDAQAKRHLAKKRDTDRPVDDRFESLEAEAATILNHIEEANRRREYLPGGSRY